MKQVQRIRSKTIRAAMRLGLLAQDELPRAGRTPVAVSMSWSAIDAHSGLTRLTLIGIPVAIAVWALGLPALDLHPLHRFGIMAPTCGLTRGVMWASRGDWARATQFNPASLLVLPTMAIVAMRCVYGRFTNRWLNVSLRWSRVMRLLVFAAVLALAIRQQSVAEFLLANPAG